MTLPNAVMPFSSVVNDLGVLLDSQLTMADHVAALSRSCFFYMHQLRLIKQALAPDPTRTLIHAFISSRLQQHICWCQRSTATEATSDPERCRPSCYGGEKIRAYDSCLT